MKVEIPSKFVRAGENINKGDIVRIIHEGKYKEGKYGKYWATVLQLADGQQKEYTPSVQTLLNLKQEWGDDSKVWIGKNLKAWVFETIKAGKKQTQLILTPESWNEPIKEKIDDIPIIQEGSEVQFGGFQPEQDEIDVKDIPF